MKYVKSLGSKWNVQSIRDRAEHISLRYALYTPEEPVNRYIVYLNGRTEWIEKNHELAIDLGLPNDCGFLTLDHRGQGASGGVRSYIDSYDTYVDDLVLLLEKVFDNDKTPYAFVCHSMGALIAIYGTMIKRLKPSAIVCAAPLLRLPKIPVPIGIARPVVDFVSSIGLATQHTGAGSYEKATFAANKLTHSYDMFEVARHSPYRIPSATFGWIKASLAAIDLVFDPARLAKYTPPTLVLSAGEEKIVDPAGHHDWIRLVSEQSSAPVRLDVIHGARHELFSEIDEYRNPALDKAELWLRQHFFSRT